MNLSTSMYSEIGPWTEIKHEIISKYAKAYTTILTKNRLSCVYIDAFAGEVMYQSRSKRELVPGSTQLALAIQPPFHHYHFIDLSLSRVEALERVAQRRSDVTIYPGDSNQILLTEVFPKVTYEQFRRGLCLLDPYGMHLDWNVVRQAAKQSTIELFINFPIMDINRNVLRRDPTTVDLVQAQRLSRFWGDDSWREGFYAPTRQPTLWGETPDRKNVGNAEVVEAYRQRLLNHAGFSHVPDPVPMKNSIGAEVYYLFFAAQKPAAGKIVADIFSKYR